MRNLRNIKHATLRFDNESQLSATSWDAADDSLVVAFGPVSPSSPTISLKRVPKNAYDPKNCINIASWDAPSPTPALPLDKILDLHVFPDTKSICVVLAGGDIVIVREDPQAGEDLIEIVGSVDAGIAAAAWSPDEELLAIATEANTFLFMTREFEGISNVVLSPDDVKVSDHVSVGWGKSETQFKGRGAKALRDPTVPEHVDQGILSTSDDCRSTISWRGDGQFVALNSILDGEPRRRIIRFFSRDGVLESVSEAVNGLESAISWKPSGQLVACVQRLEDRVDVVFFERNGLRHGEFSLRLSREHAESFGQNIALKWNNDSSVLAVSMRDRVQLWTMGNYHYYLKQELVLGVGGSEKPTASATWHSERALYLAVFNAQRLDHVAYSFEVSRGSVTTPNDQGLVAVTDGRMLKLTPLRVANAPPPMALEEVELPENAIDVAVDQLGRKIAVLHSSLVTLWDYTSDAKARRPAMLAEILQLPAKISVEEECVPRQLAITSKGNIVVIAASQNNACSLIMSIQPASGATSQWTASTSIATIFQRTDHDRIACERNDGTVSYLELHGPGVQDAAIGRLDVTCPQVEVWHGDSGDIVFGLTSAGVLYARSDSHNLRVNGVTSFVATSSHLIFTTSQHLLKFIHIGDKELGVPLDEPEKDERCRSVERGAKIVTVIPSAYSLVLQMPRGNLETIYPRALVLAGIRQNINTRDYKKAFLTCRTHRVDMNILHDYAPDQFMRSVDLMVKQLKKVEYIDLILSSLSEENVAGTIYKETLQIPVAPANPNEATNGPVNGVHSLQDSGGSKINRVCNGFLEVLTKHGERHLQNVITAHVCKSPPDLEAGLRLISDLRKKEEQTQLEQAVEHIAFLADVNQLYDTALGLYDLDVALLVAQQSQKDPREYLPYLQGLHDMEQLRQRFTIDNDLKRYHKALGHLQSIGAFEELKVYMSKHDLYSVAIDLYRYESVKLLELMELFANYLSSRNRYEEAGIAYEYVGDHTSAYEAYRAAGMWRECLTSATLAAVSESELSTLASDLAESLEESKDYASLAIVQLEYLDDLESALKALCKGYYFPEATRLAATCKRPDLLTSIVDQGLIDGSASMTEMLAEMKSQLQAQVPRLHELRQKKAEDPMAFLDGADGGEGDVPDNISLAPTDASTSAGTFMTRYTNRSTGTLATNATRKTSKNRRREERKRARGKKGTVYEEEYLVNSITRLIERLNAVSDDVARLVKGLMRRAMRERAVAVDAVMADVSAAIKGCMSEVFQTQERSNAEIGPDGDQAFRPVGGEGVLWDAMTASSRLPDPPALKAFEKLSLLGYDR